jgi:hypothetical protein
LCYVPFPSHTPWLDHINLALESKLWSSSLRSSPTSCHPIPLVQIFSSASCSRTPSDYVPPLMTGIKSHNQTTAQTKLQPCIFQCLSF